MLCQFTAEATTGLARFRAVQSFRAGEDFIDQMVFRLIKAADEAERTSLNRLANKSLSELGQFKTQNAVSGFGTLFDYLQNPPAWMGPQAQKVGGYVIEVFRETALKDLAARERFLANVFEADGAGVDGLDVLLRRVNGVTSVQGTHGALEVARLLRPGYAGVAVEVEVEGSKTLLDTVLDQATSTSVLGGSGDALALELKMTTSQKSPPDIHSQGIVYLKYLAEDLDEDPRLFRYIHNCDEATFGTHEKDEATKFMVQILKTAKQKGAFGRDAATEVVTQMKSAGVTGIKKWDPGAIVGTYDSLTPDEQAAADLVRKWFYRYYAVPGLAK